VIYVYLEMTVDGISKTMGDLLRVYRVIIIGAGIIGASIARLLSKYKNLKIFLVEKEPDVGWGATKANTAIIHPGHEDDPNKYPMRATLCAMGNRLWHRWVKELDIPVKWCGELMLAFDDRDIKELKKYMEYGEINHVPGLKIVYNGELYGLEPNVSENAIAGLWAPTSGEIEPWEAVIGLVENAVDNGVKVFFETEVRDIRIVDGEIRGVDTNKDFIGADIVINAAGLYADKISRMAGINSFKIHPRKGEYYLFDENISNINRILHPVPTPKTKGVYIVPTIEDNLLIGPTAQDLPIDAKEDTSTSSEGLEYVWNWAKKLVKKLPPKSKIIKTFAGLRPEPSGGDFILEAYNDPWGFINAAGIRSPGLASAPAIAHYIENLIKNRLDIKLIKKDKWNPYRSSITRLRNLPSKKREELIKRDPCYGRIICTCKYVTEAEIIEAIKRIEKIGGIVTLDGIKFRTLAMFGRCQGAFCRLRIAEIVAKKYNIPFWKITLKGKGSEYGFNEIKYLYRGDK